MYRGCVAAGGFGETISRATGRCGEMHAHFFRAQDFDERAEDGGLTRAWSAGENRGFMAQCVFNRVGLQGVKIETSLVGGPLHGGLNLDRWKTASDFAEA